VALTAGILFCLSPWGSPQTALALGAVLALLGVVKPGAWAKPVSRTLIQVAVVMLGLESDLKQLLMVGGEGLVFALATIVATFALGWLLCRWLRTDKTLSTLLSAGTAICGGSAIAAVGSVIGAPAASMTVAIGAVFMLNAVGLWVFPTLGHWLELSQHQFGVWCAVSVHDVSSVVGAAKQYGDEALQVATAVKLSRTLWIVPVAMAAGYVAKRGAGGVESGARKKLSAPPIPWFIAAFVAMSALRTFVPGLMDVIPRVEWTGGPAPVTKVGAGLGMTVALFLIGAGLSRATLAAVGWRPLVQAVALWVFISVTSLLVVKWG
jgi:uncharacterized integral membrane protein (TIGR00698 family)